MADRENLQLNGYCFGSYQDMEAAGEEYKKAEYFKEKTQDRNAQSLLAVYDKILDQRIFKTPVGWEYLRQLQEQLKKEGITQEQIRPIPMYINFSYKTGKELDNSFTRQRIRPAKKKMGVNGLQISVCINILLAILVFAMFIITLQSDNANILNYRKVIVNEYAAWEQELTERENKVRAKEQELQIEAYEMDERGD